MAVLGQIRKRSFFLILVIGMALFAFVIADVFNRAGPNSSSDEPIGIINDTGATPAKKPPGVSSGLLWCTQDLLQSLKRML